MFNSASKLAWVLLQPSSLLIGAIVIGMAMQRLSWRARLGERLMWGGAAGLLVAGFSPLANLALLPLEQRFPAPRLDASRGEFVAIIVLGGAEDGRIGGSRGQLTLNEAAERITEAVLLARRFPRAKIVFSGGGAGVLREERPAGRQVAAFWQAAGIGAERIVFEERSLTTFENAVETKRLLQPRDGQVFLLVTSAAHMPRSVATFRHAGFNVVAYPVDFRTKDAADVWRPFDQLGAGIKRLDDAAREWVGLIGYWLLGRSSALFPAP